MGNTTFLVLCLSAFFGIFILQNHTNGFNTEHHGFTSSRGVTMAKSLIIEKNHFVMLYNKQLLKDGTIYYNPYNRYPIFPFLITGVVMQIFEPDLSMQIYMARQVMNVFFVFSLIFCIIIVNEMLGDKLLSLVVCLSVFSSYYLLYYNDMIFADTTAVFGFVLALFLVVKTYKHNLRKLYVILLPIISISTGWQPYAVFMTWFFIDVVNQIRQTKQLGKVLKTIIKRPAFIALISSIIFGVLILGGELLLEWNIRGGRFLELPSIDSMFGKIGVTSHALEWDIFVLKQAYQIFNMVIPFSGILTGHLKLMEKLNFGLVSFTLGIAFALIGGILFIYGLKKFRQRLELTLLTVFILSGFFWSIPMRHYTAYHDYQSPFYIGFSIIFFIVLSCYIKPPSTKIIAICACLLFILSVYQINEVKSIDSQRLNAITEDFENIYAKLPKNSKVFVDSEGRYKDKLGMDVGRNELSAELGIGGQSIDFYLVGHYRTFLEDADYIVSKNPNYNQERITNNPKINLFKNVKKS
jgi:hypothetical protein